MWLNGFSQSSDEEKIDSLKKIIHSDAHDTLRIHAYYKWDDIIYIENPDLDMEINQTIVEIAKSNLKTETDPQLIRFYYDCIGRSYNVIGLILNDYGRYIEASEYLHKSLEIARLMGDKDGMAGPLNNLGMIYKSLDFHEKSLEYYLQAMEMDGDNDWSKSIYMNNLAVCYVEMEKYAVAKEYYSQSIALSEKVGNKTNLANSVGNMGEIYYRYEQWDSANYYFVKALELNEELGSDYNIAFWQGRIGMAYYHQKNYDSSLYYCRLTEQKLKHVTSLIVEVDCEKCLYLSLREKGINSEALIHLENYVSLNDSLRSKKNLEEVLSVQFQHEYESKLLEDSLSIVSAQKIKELELQSDIDKKQTQQYILYVGIFILIVVGGLIFRSYKNKKQDNLIIAQQKKEVEHQKDLIEAKNQEVIDSINYAKRIQDAILPPIHVIKEKLNKSFLYYLPKDIVAGDFYWLETTELKEEKIIFFAVADCTGHGVPGAMVSVICANALNRAVKEFNLIDPGEILDKVQELVVEAFEKSKESIKDGMDIALCAYYPEGKKLVFAGANNPLWRVTTVQNQDESNYTSENGKYELIEYKANKRPIGSFHLEQQFHSTEINLKSGDLIYLFSDGFPDQFGGDKGKKFKNANFKRLLLENVELDLKDQENLMAEVFENWRGNLEQVDDICVMGVRV